jgi:hypothetical protein
MNSQKPQTIFEEQTHRGVRQDKRPPGRSGVILSQPQTANTRAENRPKHHGSEKRKTATLSGRAPLDIKARVAAMAQAQGLSESAIVVALIKKALQVEADLQYGALLEPVISHQIHKDLQAYSNRTANLELKNHRSTEQVRILLIKVLSILLDADHKILNHLIEESDREARENVLRLIEESQN